MKFNKIMTVFLIALPVCIAARVLQILFVTEYQNGFFLSDLKVWGITATVLVALACVSLFFCAFKAYKSPETPPENNIVLSLLGICVAVALIFEAANQTFSATVPAWQISIIRAVTILCAIYFLVFSVSYFVNIKIAPAVHIIPIIYAVAKTIFTFITISSLALISDNVFLMAGYCLLMLFFINYGKLYNGLDSELNFRKILATGLASSLVCITQSAGYLLANAFGRVEYFHTDRNVIWTMLVLGLFILGFVLSHFSENTNEKRVHLKGKHTLSE